MTRDLAMFLEPLDPKPDPGLDAADPRLAEIVALADQGAYEDAANLAEAIAGEGIYDIRALSFLLYQAFREGGLAGLEEVFEAVVVALGPSFEAIGPERRRKEHFNKRLAWLFDTIIDAVEYHQKAGTPEWDTLQEGLDQDKLEAIRDAGDRVAASLASDAYARAAQGLGRLMGFLRVRAEALAKKPAPPPAAAAQPPASAPQEDMPPTSVPGSASPGEEARTSAAAPGASRSRVEIAVAQPFLDLLAKLRAFEVLVKKGEMAKAAVVAEDLQQLIESFDPRAYFPETFARFSALLSNHIEPLSEHLEERESLAWKARSQFYRVDLEGFVRS